MIVEIESLLGTDSHIATTQFTDGVAHDIMEQLVPAMRQETTRLGVETRYAGGCSHPDVSLTVRTHTHDPVIAQMARLDGIGADITVVGQLPALGIEDTESA